MHQLHKRKLVFVQIALLREDVRLHHALAGHLRSARLHGEGVAPRER